MRLGVGCPCPPVRNDIVTPRHLFLFNSCLILHLGDIEIENIVIQTNYGKQNIGGMFWFLSHHFLLFESSFEGY